ncbi:enkurin domain-containing protein 1 [Strongylocentrotus purpuratus]|uniref:Enkurin domain-containing protein n=1 Tax=Strongylocentrotus purpuratus TaxID=7668 RepID=A0A7M7NEW0_STRPU|nr:enkurin domain-containing protein 1 [Strongylocentrotus purpuratus]
MMLSGPIPTDPGYSRSGGHERRSSWSAESSRPAPRVRPEANEIATKAQGSVGNLLVTGENVYRPPTRQKPQPKDFSKDNVRRMRQIQSKSRNKQREEVVEKNKPMKVLPQSEKYKVVASKVTENLKKSPPPPRPASANYLRSHSRTGAVSRGRSPSPAPRPSSASSEVSLHVDGSATNFIAHNAKLAKKVKPQRPPSAQALESLQKKKEGDMERYKRGHTPKYLQSRQNQWQRESEERIRNMPDPDMPPGHRKMAEEERLKTLEILKEKEKDLQNTLRKFPLSVETLRAKNQKAEIENRLSEVEEAIKIFTRRKVFVKVDS